VAHDAPETVIVAEDDAALYLQVTTMAVWHPHGRCARRDTRAAHPSRNCATHYSAGANNAWLVQGVIMPPILI